MYGEITELLACPICKSKMKLGKVFVKEGEEIIEGTIKCENKHKFYIKYGVLDFHFKENRNIRNFTELYLEKNFTLIDENIENNTPKNLKKINDECKNEIVRVICKKDYKYILDIASGRGIALEEMAKNLSKDKCVISADINFAALKYNRLKNKKYNPKCKMNYIACDCESIPFLNNSIECIVSFYGFPNMLKGHSEAIKESFRVLKSRGRVLDSRILVSDKDEYFNKIKETSINQLNFLNPEDILVGERVAKLYKNIGFSDIKIEKIWQSIGEENIIDLVPVKGQKFKISLLSCKK